MESLRTGDLCLRFEANLPAYLEGEGCPDVPAHAEVCEFCRCILADVETIRGLGPQLALVDPPARVWSSIRAQLVDEGTIRTSASFWRRWLPASGRGLLRYPAPIAVAAAAAIAALVLFKTPGYINRSPMQSANVIHDAVFTQGFMAPRDIGALKQTITQLEKAYQANESSLEPSMKATYQKSLNSLDNEIQECQISMQQEPGNGLAGQYLSSAYVEKAELLQSALEYNLR